MENRNQRQFNRINYEKEAVVEFADEEYKGCKIKNLSLSGIFIAGNFKPSQNKKCYISFVRDIGELNISFIEVLGEVVRENSDGIGIKITSMHFDHYRRLVTELINNAEEPMIILSEIPKSCPYTITDEKLSVFQ